MALTHGTASASSEQHAGARGGPWWPLLPVPTSSRPFSSTDSNYTPWLCSALPPCLGSLPPSLCWQRPHYCPRLGSAPTGSGGPSDSLGQTGVLLPLRPVCAVGLLCHNCVTLQRLSPQQTTGLTGWGPRLSLLLSLTERGARGRPTLGVCRGVTSGWYRTLTLGLRHPAARRCPANEFRRGRTLRNWLLVTPRTSGPRPSRVCTYHVSPLSDVLAAYAGHAVDGSWFDVP